MSKEDKNTVNKNIKSIEMKKLISFVIKNINEHEDIPAHELNNDTDSFTHLNEEISKHITEDEIIKQYMH